MVSVLLALGAGMAWGVSDFLGGLNSRSVTLAAVLLVSQVVGLILLVPLAVLHGGPLLDGPTSGLAVAGSVAGLVGVAALYRGMAVGSVSVVAPISATGAAVPIFFGLLRGERPTVLQIVGIALALVGIVLASLVVDRRQAGGRPILAAGVGLACLAALGFGGYFVLLHAASVVDVLWAGVVQRLTGVCIVGAVALVLRPKLALGWRRLGGLGVVGALDTGANVLYAYASTLGLVSLSAVLASMFPVVTVILAGVVLRERMSTVQGAGVACALTGVALIAIQ
jgi:drug/metabolite transporter (DMT)-like permease